MKRYFGRNRTSTSIFLKNQGQAINYLNMLQVFLYNSVVI